jgi:septum formation topological specificity factor MinE
MTHTHEQEHRGASEQSAHTWAAEVAAMAASAQPRHHEQSTESATPFKHHVDIEMLQPKLDQGYESPSTRGVVTAISVQDQEGNTGDYPPALTVTARRGPADLHDELVEKTKDRIFTVTWRGKTFSAMAHWNEIPPGVVDWQVSNAMTGEADDPAETARDRLQLTVAMEQQGPAPDDALVRPLTYAVTESLVQELIKYSESNAAQRQLMLTLQTTHGDAIASITTEGSLGDLGIESASSKLDHNRFINFLEKGKP